MTIYGGQDPVTGEGIERALSVQLQYSYFPIREAELKANVQYVTLKPDATAQIGSASVTPVLLNHPVLNFGYRIEADGKALFFTGDYEPPFNIYAPEDKELAVSGNRRWPAAAGDRGDGRCRCADCRCLLYRGGVSR